MTDNAQELARENETSIRLINQKLDYITEELREVKNLLKEGYITRTEADGCHNDFEKRIAKLENINSRLIWKIVSPIISVLILGAGFLMFFLNFPSSLAN
jgi:uncharacterized coiled-coil protein SlyX